jgi:hypothetical protein
MFLRITYRHISDDKIVKVSFGDLELKDIYSAINDYTLSSIYELLAILITKKEA